MNHLVAKMIERHRVRIVEHEQKVRELDREIKQLPKIRWFKRRELREKKAEIRSWIKSLRSGILRAGGDI